MIATKLDDALIEKCNMTGWILADSSLNKTKIYDCNVCFSNFERTSLSDAGLSGGKFTEVCFAGAHSEAPTRLYAIKLIDVSWHGAKIHLQCKDVDFERGDFGRANFFGSPFMRCTFNGPIELELCRGYRNLSGCTLNNVNLLPLEYMPDMIPEDQFYERENKRHSRYESDWKSVIKWFMSAPDEPHGLCVDLTYYEKFISTFDAQMRRHLREKVLALAERMPSLQTSGQRARIEEILALDDALTGAESNRSRGESVDTADSVSAAENQPPATSISNVGNQNNDVNSFRLFP